MKINILWITTVQPVDNSVRIRGGANKVVRTSEQKREQL